jgi:hypothetical protein
MQVNRMCWQAGQSCSTWHCLGAAHVPVQRLYPSCCPTYTCLLTTILPLFGCLFLSPQATNSLPVCYLAHTTRW